MKIGIITAMQIEFDELSIALIDRSSIASPFFESTQGSLGDQTVVLLQAGVGKVCTAMATQWLIGKFAPDLLLDIGIAGSLSDEAPVGSVVIGARFVQHDFMAAPWLGRAQGEVSLMGDRSYPVADETMNRTIVDIVRNNFEGAKIQFGTILSGDEPIFSLARKEALALQFTSFKPLAVDMESAAFAFTAAENKVPFAVIRAIADRATKQDEPVEPGSNARANGTVALVAQIASALVRSLS